MQYEKLPDALTRLFPPVEKFWIAPETQRYINEGWGQMDPHSHQKLVTETKRRTDSSRKLLFVVDEVTNILCNKLDNTIV